MNPRKLLRGGQATFRRVGTADRGQARWAVATLLSSAEASVGGRCPPYTATSAVPFSSWALWRRLFRSFARLRSTTSSRPEGVSAPVRTSAEYQVGELERRDYLPISREPTEFATAKKKCMKSASARE